MRPAVKILVGLCLLEIPFVRLAPAEEPTSAAGRIAKKLAAPPANRFAKQPVPIEGVFGEGWEQTVELPATRATEGEVVKLWVDQGLLHVRRESAANELDWQFVLCRTDEMSDPEIFVKEGMRFFEVRLDGGRL